MKYAEPTKLHRKLGMWGTHWFLGQENSPEPGVILSGDD
jgi:hypothetical protein